MVGVGGSSPLAPTSIPEGTNDDLDPLSNYVHRQLIRPDEFALSKKCGSTALFCFWSTQE
jgi:hypothetical protein